MALYLHSRDFIYSFPLHPETITENFVVTNGSEETEKETRSLSLDGRLRSCFCLRTPTKQDRLNFTAIQVASVLDVPIYKEHMEVVMIQRLSKEKVPL